MTEATTTRFRRMNDGVRIPTNGNIYAYVINEQGRPTKVILPPRNTRPVGTGIEVGLSTDAWTHLLLSTRDLAIRSVFVASNLLRGDQEGELKVLLYNGGFETQYISHGDLIAQMIPLSGEDE